MRHGILLLGMATIGIGGAIGFGCGADTRTFGKGEGGEGPGGGGGNGACDALSCDAESRTCGKSSCGFDCGGCESQCEDGEILAFECSKAGDCGEGNPSTCGGHLCATKSTCATTCKNDDGCLATHFCDGATCAPKKKLSEACSGGGTGNHECVVPNVCAWDVDGDGATCVAPIVCPGAPAASDTQYVDPVEGTDDAAFGGAQGPCAYKTLTYALGHATGTIVLAPQAEYSNLDSNTADQKENVPFFLTGAQRIDCRGGKLAGSAPDGNSRYGVIVLKGTSNEIFRCTVEAPNGGTIPVQVFTAGSGDGHRITQCDISRGAPCIYADLAGTNITLSDSHIHDCDGIGVFWYPADAASATVSMTNNTFLDNYSMDIMCGSDAASNVTGSGNSREGLSPFCDYCPNCPFGP